MTDKKLADRLNWSEMLGFEQVVEIRDSLQSAGSARLGAKVGDKPTGIGTKTGVKPTIKIGVKTGEKPVG